MRKGAGPLNLSMVLQIKLNGWACCGVFKDLKILEDFLTRNGICIHQITKISTDKGPWGLKRPHNSILRLMEYYFMIIINVGLSYSFS